MKTLFFGTPELAVPFLELVSNGTQLAAVVTTPDEPSGRGYTVHAPPVKVATEKLKLPVLQPTDLKSEELLSKLRAYSPDLVIVVAYGKILPAALLKISKHGFLNVHFSLLPAYRGAAPIQRALMQGEKRTGVTLFWLDEGMDTGPILIQKELPIAEDDDADSLREKLVPLGLQTLQEALTKVEQGQIERKPQTGPASLAHSLKKEEGKINWNKSAIEIVNLIRGTTPWPGAYTAYNTNGEIRRLKIVKAKVVSSIQAEKSTEIGMVAGLDKGRGFVVKCSQDFLQIIHVQPEGKRPMSAWEFWQGARMKLGDKLG
jgi:methionyl-tRNA formyltransferase